MLEKIFNISWGGIKTIKFMYKVNKDTRSCILMLEIVVYGLLWLVLGIYGIGFTGMWNISKG